MVSLWASFSLPVSLSVRGPARGPGRGCGYARDRAVRRCRYPNDAEKQRLADVTNISIKQLNTWFTNSRKRIWAPHRRKHGKPVPQGFGPRGAASLQQQLQAPEPQYGSQEQESREDVDRAELSRRSHAAHLASAAARVPPRLPTAGGNDAPRVRSGLARSVSANVPSAHGAAVAAAAVATRSTSGPHAGISDVIMAYSVSVGCGTMAVGPVHPAPPARHHAMDDHGDGFGDGGLFDTADMLSPGISFLGDVGGGAGVGAADWNGDLIMSPGTRLPWSGVATPAAPPAAPSAVPTPAFNAADAELMGLVVVPGDDSVATGRALSAMPTPSGSVVPPPLVPIVRSESNPTVSLSSQLGAAHVPNHVAHTIMPPLALLRSSSCPPGLAPIRVPRRDIPDDTEVAAAPLPVPEEVLHDAVHDSAGSGSGGVAVVGDAGVAATVKAEWEPDVQALEMFADMPLTPFMTALLAEIGSVQHDEAVAHASHHPHH